MRKMLALLGALALCATPAAAQRSGPSAPLETASAQAVDRPAPATPAAPSLFPTSDEVRAQVRANEEARESRGASAMVQRDWLYLVAAIAVGVIIAAVVLD